MDPTLTHNTTVPNTDVESTSLQHNTQSVPMMTTTTTPSSTTTASPVTHTNPTPATGTFTIAAPAVVSPPRTTEVRGKRELELVTGAASSSAPMEHCEADIDPSIYNVKVDDVDTLRCLTDFYFCTADGSPVSLNLLETPVESRPKILGFGTLVEPLTKKEAETLMAPYWITLDEAAVKAAPGSKRKKSAAKKRKATTPTSKSKKPKPESKKSVPTEDDNTPPFVESTTTTNVVPNSDAIAMPDHSATAVVSSIENTTEAPIAFSTTETLPLEAKTSGSVTSHQMDGLSPHPATMDVSSSSDSSDSDSSDSDNISSSVSETSTVISPDQETLRTPPLKVTSSSTTIPEAVASSVLPTSIPKAEEKVSSVPVITESQLNVLESGFEYPTEKQRMRIFLPEIQEWCLDYTEGDPTLWVITNASWYKVAGPISGLLPHPTYRSTFEPVRKLFEACFRVSNLLRDWLPQNKNLSYRATLNEIVEQSNLGRYPLTPDFLMDNYDFIYSQIADLDKEDSTRVGSAFFKQLKRLRDFKVAREQKKKVHAAEVEARRIEREKERDERRLKKALREKKLKEEQRVKKEAAEAARKEAERYPMEDLELLEEGVHVMPLKELPKPVSTKTLAPPEVLGDIVMIWQTISTFGEHLELSPISLEALASALKTGNPVILVGELFIALMQAILNEGPYNKMYNTVASSSNTNSSGTMKNSSVSTYGLSSLKNSLSLEDMLNHIGWPEVLRRMISMDLSMDYQIGKFYPMAECERLFNAIYLQKGSSPFNVLPVELPEDYRDVVATPLDLRTIDERLKSGFYEVESTGGVFQGHDVFAKDVRLVFENAMLYNGEDSDIGKAALAFLEAFDVDFTKSIPGKISRNNTARSLQSEMESTLNDKDKLQSSLQVKLVDIVSALAVKEYHLCPFGIKVAALSWVCSEFLKLKSICAKIEHNTSQSFELVKNFRKDYRDIETKRRQLERERRKLLEKYEEEEENNNDGELVKQLEEQELREEAEIEEEHRVLRLKHEEELKNIPVRVAPLGTDRFHNRYWYFHNDTLGRIFFEDYKSGEFMIYNDEADVRALLQFLNPKGLRENALRVALADHQSVLMKSSRSSSSSSCMSYRNFVKMAEEGEEDNDNVQCNEVLLFPEDLSLEEFYTNVFKLNPVNDYVHTIEGIREMLLHLEARTFVEDIVGSEWEQVWKDEWTLLVNAANCASDFTSALRSFESYGIKHAKAILNTNWIRRRQEWLGSLNHCKTLPGVYVITRLLSSEMIRTEALVDLTSGMISRKSWLKLRPTISRSSHIPNTGDHVMYYSTGHSLALGADVLKGFVWEGDSPLRNHLVAQEFIVNDVTYHTGGGDPYARVTLGIPKKLHAITKVGKKLVSVSSASARVCHLIRRILTKLEAEEDTVDFKTLVDKKSYPEYYEIVTSPICLNDISKKIDKLQYESSEEFLADLTLLRDNCVLFCEDRFPDLPVVAIRLVDAAAHLVRRHTAEFASAETPLEEGDEKVIESEEEVPESFTVVLRLENRLPEFLVDVPRYNTILKQSKQQLVAGRRFKLTFRDEHGAPADSATGTIFGSLPFDKTFSGSFLPWESMLVGWDDVSSTQEEVSYVNPWEVELL